MMVFKKLWSAWLSLMCSLCMFQHTTKMAGNLNSNVLSVTQVSTACGSGRVICGKQTRPLPQAVLTRNAMSTGYMQSQTAINVGPNDADIDYREPILKRIGISVQGDS